MSEPNAFQAECLALIRQLNETEFQGWFLPSWCMATVQVESAFRPQAYRFEPRLKEASWGLGQVLASTARSLGLVGPPTQLYQPLIGLRYMMRCHVHDFKVLMGRLGRVPTLYEWADAYNRGAYGSDLGDPDHAYVELWGKAQAYWSDQDEPTGQEAQHASANDNGEAHAE